MNTSEKIKQLRISKGLSQEALGKMIGVQRAAINKYEKGTVVNIKRSTLQKLANALGVSPADLLDDEETRPYNFHLFGTDGPSAPVYEAAAGEGRVTDWYSTEEASFVVPDDSTVVTVKGRSMEPTLLDGDMVIVVAQNVLDYPRQIALVKINGDEATLKRVEIKENGIMLIGDNVDVYPPHFYTAQEVKELPVKIEGVVVQLIRNLR